MPEKQITLRDATSEDIQFLARLYSDTRRQEVGSWGWPPEHQKAFFQMQFEAQCRSYRASYPGASDSIICLDGFAAGRMLVGSEAAAKRIIDIALLEEHRNRGIGTDLLRQLLHSCESEGTTLRLQVLQGNRAIRLYKRLGFVQDSVGPMYVQMQWTPARLRKAS